MASQQKQMQCIVPLNASEVYCTYIGYKNNKLLWVKLFWNCFSNLCNFLPLNHVNQQLYTSLSSYDSMTNHGCSLIIIIENSYMESKEKHVKPVS